MSNPLGWLIDRLPHRSRFARAAPAGTIGTVVLLGPQAMLAGAELSGWRAVVAASLEHARVLLTRGEIAVVLCDPGALRMNWKPAIRLLAASSSRPSILLLAPPGQRFAWSEVAAAGGYDVIRLPIDAAALERSMRWARAHWLSRRALESSTPADPLRR